MYIYIIIINFLAQVITIFSASNYYAMGSNKGAYMRLNNQLIPHFVQYVSAASQAKRLTFKQRVGIVESAALKELAVRMREHRDELETQFRKYDPHDKGCINIAKWCYVMEEVTKLGLPWRLLRDKLAPGTDSQSVNYFRTLDLLDTDVIVCTIWCKRVVSIRMLTLHSADGGRGRWNDRNGCSVC